MKMRLNRLVVSGEGVLEASNIVCASVVKRSAFKLKTRMLER